MIICGTNCKLITIILLVIPATNNQKKKIRKIPPSIHLPPNTKPLFGTYLKFKILYK